MKYILYTIGCPKCKILAMKLDKAGIKYELCDDREKMDSLGFQSVPQLEITGEDGNSTILKFEEAIKYLRELDK